MIPIATASSGVTFKIKVHPRGKRNAITGVIGDALKVSLTSPPVDGKANQSCIAFFAALFKVPRNAVTIAAGESSRNKVIRIVNLSADDARNAIRAISAGRF